MLLLYFIELPRHKENAHDIGKIQVCIELLSISTALRWLTVLKMYLISTDAIWNKIGGCLDL